MPDFVSQSVKIAYQSYGDGPPLVLVHGFASNGYVNWVQTGWVQTLVDAGYTAITIDNRGHGESEKPHDPEAYPARTMAHDVLNLIDHLGLDGAGLMGYSMGARISAFAALDAPQKVKLAVFGGLGINMIKGLSNSHEIIDGLRARSLEDVQTRAGRQFRIFAEHTKSDLEALAACMASSRVRISAEDVAHIAAPVLVAVGSDDEIGGDPKALADLMPRGEALVIARRDHMRATGDPQFKRGVLSFLDRVYPHG